MSGTTEFKKIADDTIGNHVTPVNPADQGRTIMEQAVAVSGAMKKAHTDKVWSKTPIPAELPAALLAQAKLVMDNIPAILSSGQGENLNRFINETWDHAMQAGDTKTLDYVFSRFREKPESAWMEELNETEQADLTKSMLMSYRAYGQQHRGDETFKNAIKKESVLSDQMAQRLPAVQVEYFSKAMEYGNIVNSDEYKTADDCKEILNRVKALPAEAQINFLGRNLVGLFRRDVANETVEAVKALPQEARNKFGDMILNNPAREASGAQEPSHSHGILSTELMFPTGTTTKLEDRAKEAIAIIELLSPKQQAKFYNQSMYAMFGSSAAYYAHQSIKAMPEETKAELAANFPHETVKLRFSGYSRHELTRAGQKIMQDITAIITAAAPAEHLDAMIGSLEDSRPGTDTLLDVIATLPVELQQKYLPVGSAVKYAGEYGSASFEKVTDIVKNYPSAEQRKFFEWAATQSGQYSQAGVQLDLA